MADNYLEKRFEDMQARRAKEERAKQVAWKKRMDAYRKKLEQSSPDGKGIATDGVQEFPEK